jgi:carboxymethylenebutenolidase
MATARGYVVVLVHYFDATGTCPDDPTIMNAGAPRFKAWVAATRGAVSYAAAQPNVDPERIGLVGFSLGSFVALSTASVDSRVKAVVDMYGALPAAYAGNVKRMPPVILFHGECDDKVSVCEAVKLAKSLEAKGVPHEIYVYPGQPHMLNDAANRDASDRTFNFLGRYL